MSRITLALVALAGVGMATFTPSLTVRAQSATRFEYVRLAPYMMRTRVAADAVQERQAYRACVAGVEEWKCREFLPAGSSTDPLRTALATLGNEGWELVSSVQEEPAALYGLTYLFKRSVR